MDEYCFAINQYLKDKHQVRQQLADNLDLDIDAAKEIINALFAGAVISKHTDSDIYHIVAGDLARIEYLKQDKFIQELVSDIKTCWLAIKPQIPMRTRMVKGRERRLPITARQKWRVYFELERCVLEVVVNYLRELNIRYFLMHDGWTCDTELNMDELVFVIERMTGYKLNLNNTINYPSVLQVAGV
jgi:hypothetical protein